MLDEIRRKLSPRDVGYFKLAVWAALLVWSVSFITISFFVAQSLANWGESLFTGFWGELTGFVWAVTYVMTVFYIIYLIMRWTNKKLRGQK